MNWHVEILELLALQQEGERAAGLPGLAGAPATGAKEGQLAECERKLGFSLDSRHRTFLTFADGWEGFNGDIDLLSTEDFAGSARFSQARDWVRKASKTSLGIHARNRNALFPIAICKSLSSAFVMTLENGRVLPVVHWFAGEPVQQFPNFDELFASMKEYARQAIDHWLAKSKRQPRLD